MEVGANLVLDTDTHSPSDLISYETAHKIALGAGLKGKDIEKVLEENPQQILKRKNLL